VYAGDDETPAFGQSVQEALEDMQPTHVTLTETVAKTVGGAKRPAVALTWVNSADEDYLRCQIWYKLATATSKKSWKKSGGTTGASHTIKGLRRGKAYNVALLPMDTSHNVLEIKRATKYEIEIGEVSSASDLDLDDGTVLSTSTIATGLTVAQWMDL
jgi:hypothetical protein